MLMALGWLAARGAIVQAEHIRGMGRFVINFALPALIIHALSEQPLDEMFNGHYLLAYGLGSLATLALGLALTFGLQRRRLDHAAIEALGMATANSGFIGYPVAAMVIGQSAGIALALCMLVENMLMLPICLTLAESGRQQQGSLIRTLTATFSRLGRTPVFIAIIGGALLSLSGIRLPGWLSQAVDMLASASAPVALFVIGGTLYGLKVRGMYRRVGQIALAKLILHPLMVLLFFQLFPLEDTALMTGALLIAGAPMLSIYPIFGARFAMDGLCAAALLTATVASFFTLSVALWLLGAAS
ncbi:AEC family transporter [Kushneria aurantia]|uniref:AEC family transporter n=1 Tax=Kushneria aurantia TaxID=504092 RepID=A0ABV6FZ21_9GAMM